MTIDRYGRIVIPKSIRDKFGLEADTMLELEVESDRERAAISLRPIRQEEALVRKGDVLVHSGRLTDETFDITEHIRGQRAERARHVSDR